MKLRGLMVYEKGGLLIFKNFLFISQLFVVPSLNVTKTNDLGCVPLFSTISRHLEINVTTKFFYHLWTR